MYVGLSTSCSDTEYILETPGHCRSCRECRAGFQPKIPCGSTIGIHDSIGTCEECPSGTSSENEDTKSCQICRSKMCFEHQVFEGTCAPTKDTSKCTNKCDDGYQMNILGTKCEVHRPQPSTAKTPTNESPMPTMLTTKNNATKKLDVLQNQKGEEAKLHVGYIILIVLIVAVGIIVIFLKFILPKLRVTRTNGPKGNSRGLYSKVHYIQLSSWKKNYNNLNFNIMHTIKTYMVNHRQYCKTMFNILHRS